MTSAVSRLCPFEHNKVFAAGPADDDQRRWQPPDGDHRGELLVDRALADVGMNRGHSPRRLAGVAGRL
jgi:hypothetical protein